MLRFGAPLAGLYVAMLGEPSRAQSVAPPNMSEIEPNASVTVGGELRERYESTRNAGFGLSSPAHNDYLLHRASVFADLRRGDKLRGLVEVVAGFASGWKGSPPPTQDDPLDLLQAYVEPSIPLARGKLAVRAGRQELSLGSSRLVSIRESPNIRRAFDGVRTTWTRGEGRSLDAFLVLPVSPEDGIFDDASAADRQFWGVYATRPVGAVPRDRCVLSRARSSGRGLRARPGTRAAEHGRSARVRRARRLGLERRRRLAVGLVRRLEHPRMDDFRGRWIRALERAVVSAPGTQGRRDQRRPRPSRRNARHVQSAVSEASLFLGSEPRDTGESVRCAAQRAPDAQRSCELSA